MQLFYFHSHSHSHSDSQSHSHYDFDFDYFYDYDYCYYLHYKMEKIFMNTENSNTNESHRFKLDLADKLNLKNPNKNIALVNLSIYYTWKIIKSEYNDNKFKTSAPTWNETFDLPDGSYTISSIQDYFEFIIKKHETLTENPSIQLYPNKIKNRIVFKIKTGYKLELLTPETMNLLGSTNKVVDKDENGENVILN